MSKDRLSIYLSYLLRHNPNELSLSMDCHGWVPIEELIERINQRGKYHISREVLQEIVVNDKKGRYRFSQDQSKIKACQGHSISWVEPELEYTIPPSALYHGTTWTAYQDICKSGAINKMGRHAVHLTAVESRAWQSARRRKARAVVLKIDADKMYKHGFVFGVSENEVWCTETIPVQFVVEVLGENGQGGSKVIN